MVSGEKLIVLVVRSEKDANKARLELARIGLQAFRQFEGLAEDPETTGKVDQPDARPLRARYGSGCETLAAGLPGHHEVMAVCVAEGVDCRPERLIGVLVDVDQPGQRRGRQSRL